MAEKSIEERQAEMRARLATQNRRVQPEPFVVISADVAEETSDSPRDKEQGEAADRGIGPNHISRRDLYRLVWREPLIKVALRFGVSDVAVAKACRRHDIPLPGRGYWARIEAGQEIARTPLPAGDGSGRYVVTFTGVDSAIKEARKAASADIQSGKSSHKVIAVAEEPDNLHPLVRRTLIELTRAKPNDDGLLQIGRDSLGVYVSSQEISRSIAVMDALIKALESRGYPVTISTEPVHPPEAPSYSYWHCITKWKPYGKSIVTIVGEDLGFGVSEGTTRVPHVPTIAEKKKLAKGERYGIPEHDVVPDGELHLWMSVPYGLSLRSRWGDGKKQRVEGCLNSFIAGLIVAAHRIKKAREDAEIEDQKRREEARIREQRHQEHLAEQERVRKLDAEMSGWKRGENIRRYAKAVEALAIREYGEVDAATEVGRWISWMIGYADKIDPLTVSDEQDD